MVFRVFSFAAAIAAISVTLRERDQEVSELTSETGLLGILTRSVEKAHSSEHHRLQLLEEAASVLSRLHSNGSNASIHMDDSQKDLFRKVLNMIEGSIFDSVNQSHDNTVESLERSVDPVQACDVQKDYRIDEADGDIFQDEHRWHEFRDKHSFCRREEEQAYALHDSTWEDFEHYYHNLVGMSKWEFPEPRSIHSLNGYFMKGGPIWVLKYYKNQAEYKRLRNIWEEAKLALDEKTQQCFRNLTEMNMQYCAYQVGLRDCCIGYRRCREREVSNYYAINASAHKSAKSRKKIWKHGVYIIEHVKCLIGDGCADVPTDDSHYDVEAPDLTGKTPCSIAPVESEVCTASFDKFLNLTGRYAEKQLKRCQGANCPKCIRPKLVNRSKDDCTDSHGNFTNAFGSSCIYYDDHMSACGKSQYDGSDGFDSRIMCCSCGGGDPPLENP